MTNPKITAVGFFALWFGAAVSLAEIMTGSLLAPLNMKNGLIVILLGHLVGGLFLSLAGYIGFREKKPALETCRLSLGIRGSYLISVLNVIQLIGWTAVMLIQAAKAIRPLSMSILGLESFKGAVIFLGFLIFFWSVKMEKGSRRINELSVILLVILTAVMGYLSLTQPQVIHSAGSFSIGLGFELSVIMPLSWTPLIGDYTRQARSAKGSFWGCFLGYFIGSSLMYTIGLSCGMYSGTTDPIQMMLNLKLGLLAFLIVILATVTTTFMDIYSAVFSTTNILKSASRFWLIGIYSVLGTTLALYFPMEDYQNFLYLIGSIFAPTFTIVFMDYFLFKVDRSLTLFNLWGIVCLSLGTSFYYWIQKFDFIIGSTVPTIFFTVALYGFVRRFSFSE